MPTLNKSKRREKKKREEGRNPCPITPREEEKKKSRIIT